MYQDLWLQSLNSGVLLLNDTLSSSLPTYDVEVTCHLFGSKAVGDLADVVAAVLEPQVGNGEASDAPRPAGV